MEELLGKFVMSYLLMPLIAVLLGSVMFFIAKKNQLLRNRKLIGYCIIMVILLVAPATAALVKYSFMPYFYMLSLLFYFLLGTIHLKTMMHFIPESQKWLEGGEDNSYTYELTLTLLLMIIGMVLYSFVFDLCNDLQYGLWASTAMLPFLFVSVFRRTYYSFLDIPLEIYKVWNYSEDRTLHGYNKINESDLMVVEVELTRNPETDSATVRISAQAVETMIFGEWFQIFVQDYNKKFPAKHIACNDDQTTYGWIFYVKPSFFHSRRYIDPDESFRENRIASGSLIVAKRVRQELVNK